MKVEVEQTEEAVVMDESKVLFQYSTWGGGV
jgi:hypothetical protein